MAQTGFTPISLYYTATAAATPTAGNLVAGELALNNNDGKLFYKDSSGVVQTIASKSAAALANSTTGTGATVLATSPTVTNLALGGSTSGSVTLAVPAVAGSNTATLPAATGTVMVSGNMPTFRAYLNNASQTLTSGTATKAVLNGEDWDTNNCFDTTTNYRFTPTVAGYYWFNAKMRAVASASLTNVVVRFYKNGSNFNESQFFPSLLNSTNPYTNSVGCMISLNGSTDYVELYISLIGTGTLTLQNGNGAGGGSEYSTVLEGFLARAA
jgi:hypothetical protein